VKLWSTSLRLIQRSCSLFASGRTPKQELAKAEIPIEQQPTFLTDQRKPPRARGQLPPTAPPAIPEHKLLRCVGRGAYGEVWLARKSLRKYRAVKIVYRHRFPNDVPYEREFKGLQKYTTIAHLHPGWVQIMRVDRNDAGRYFFCIMEAADDETTGQKIDPKTYEPKTLSRILRRRGRLPLAECIPLGLTLTAALEHLHVHSLIHRDIKPSNVIFVHGAPKFADVGLVTDMRTANSDVSYLGTEGYMAPEGPGTPAADVYSLGKLLYEITMGRDRREFPELPSTLLRQADEREWQCFHQILFKACEIRPQPRYQSASELRADLLKLQAMLENK